VALERLVGLRDPIELQAGGDARRETAGRECRGEVDGGLALGGGGEVVAAEQAQGDVLEQQLPERQSRCGIVRRIGGDDRALRRDRCVELRVGVERYLHDMDGWSRCRGAGRPPLAGAQRVALAELGRLPLRLPERAANPPLVDLVVGACRAAGFEPRLAAAMNDQDMLAAIAAGPPTWTVYYAS
jgi:hypothetical protein